MKKYWLFGIVCSFFLAGSASADVVVASGIDLLNSTVTVAFSEEPGTDNSLRFTCFGEGPYITLPQQVLKSFSDLGITEVTPAMTEILIESADCFYQAGNYALDIHIQDNAGNETDLPTYVFQVKAGNVDLTQSIIVCLNCGGGGQTANNTDEYQLSIELRDEYENPITQLGTVTTELTNSEYTDDANTDTKFIAGLRYDDNSIPTNPKIMSGPLGDFDFAMKALAPTISQVAGGLLAQVVSRTLNFDILVNLINNDGGLSTDTAIISLSEPVTFDNIFALEPTGQGFIWKGEVAAEGTINLDLSVGATAPTTRTAGITEHNDNLVYTGLVSNSIPFSAPKITDTLNVTVAAEDDDAYDMDQVFSLTTSIAYSLGGLPISHPAGGTGFSGQLGGVNPIDIIGYTDDISPTIVGADIEGGIIGDMDKLEIQPKSTIQTFNISEATNKLRDQITENVFRLSRGSSNVQAPGEFSNDWFDTYDVVIVEVENGNVTIPAGATIPSGKNTLIVRNGNLIIEGDMAYTNPEDSFGVILLNEAKDDQDNGNIFIKSNVRTIVGTYYADGGLMTNDTTPPTVATASNAEGANFTQLLLTGTLFSQNTLGGSMILPPEGFLLPWGRTDGGETADLEYARKYDLHYVRRYQPILINAVTGIPFDNTTNCAAPSGSCDSNENAFVIRIDRKASVAPPPGFESTGSIVR